MIIARLSSDQSKKMQDTDLPAKRIGILVVAYNAVATLAKVLRRIPQNVWDRVEEVAVFDDASHDDTFELGLGFKTITGLEHLTVIKNVKNLGYGGNQKLGYQYFMDKGFDIVILLHGDGQYAPELLEEMYMPLVREEADAVFGSRMMTKYGGALKGHMPLYKFVGNKILTFFENRMLGMRLTEFHSGYRAYSLAALKRFDLSNMTDDFHFDTEIIIKLQHQSCRIKEIPIPTYYGDEISYVNGMKYAWDIFKSVIRYKRTISSKVRYPEFAEFFVHYPLKDSKFSSHYYFQRLAGVNSNILDVGCGEGFFAERLSSLGNRVAGIDILPEAKHADSLSAYIQADLDKGLGSAIMQLEDQKFDKVLLQDVLEHLRDPETLLKDCAKVLKPNGQVLVSVPNIANITVRLSLLFGRFEYTDRGILDKTHVHFYTRRTAKRLLEENGYEIQQSLMTIMPVELALGISAHNPLMRLATQILNVLTKLFPGLLGYQCVFVASPKRNICE
jgi:2-polyprenyl-3-methyl-5-hydroxy-6-metoxy-1,4-benzoquinol methylase